MNRIFAALGRRIEKNPFKILLVSVFIFAVLMTGARVIRMATGNETLVDTDHTVYQSNEKMEETFGGDSVLILFQGEKEDLLSLETLEKMFELQKRFEYEEEVRTILSPAAVLHSMTVNGSEELKENLLVMGEGLGEMGEKIEEVGHTLKSKDVMDPQLMGEKLDGLRGVSDHFSKLITGQENIAAGTAGLQTGLSEVSEGLAHLSLKLVEFSSLSEGNPQLTEGLRMASESLKKSAEGLTIMASKTENLKNGADQTATGLTEIERKLSGELNEMKGALSDGVNPKELEEMADGFLLMGENLSQISEGLLTFYDKSSMMKASFPGTETDLKSMLYDENEKIRSVFHEVLPNDESALMVLKLEGNLTDAKKDQMVEIVMEAVEKEELSNLTVTVSGKPVLDSALRSEMKSNMARMVGFAVVIMLGVLVLVFKVEWRALSLAIILISVLATLGVMGYLSIPVTMVSMAVFPILIGLGIDYSIQFHNRFEEEGSVETTLKHMGKAVFIAVAATVLGFASLYISPVPMIRDFGKMLTVGVTISFIGSVIVLMPVLYLRNKNRGDRSGAMKKNIKEKGKEGVLDRFLKRTTELVLRASVPVLLLAALLAASGYYLDQKIGVESNIETFMPQEMEALKDIKTLRQVVGSTDQIALYMVSEDFMTEEAVAFLQQTEEKLLSKYPDEIVSVGSLDTLISNFRDPREMSHKEYTSQVEKLPQMQREMFLSEDRTKGLLLLNTVSMSAEDLQIFTENLAEDIADAPYDIYVTGKGALDVEMVKGLTTGRMEMTLLGLGLVFLALLLVYRNIMKAFIPMIPVLVIIGISSGLMYYLGIQYTPITATIGALVLGMGVEMTIMLTERYLEERLMGKDKKEAMIHGVSTIGKAIVASGLTTVGGFSVLMLSDFVILKDFGLMTVINISLALLSTLVVLPPVLVLFDRFLFSKKEKEIWDI